MSNIEQRGDGISHTEPKSIRPIPDLDRSWLKLSLWFLLFVLMSYSVLVSSIHHPSTSLLSYIPTWTQKLINRNTNTVGIGGPIFTSFDFDPNVDPSPTPVIVFGMLMIIFVVLLS